MMIGRGRQRKYTGDKHTERERQSWRAKERNIEQKRLRESGMERKRPNEGT